MGTEPLRRYKTHVLGFDENIGEGIPQGHIIFIAGVTGSMKSSLAYSLLYNNAKIEGINGLYISLEQSKRTLVRQMEGMGFDGETLGRIEVLDLGGSTVRPLGGSRSWTWARSGCPPRARTGSIHSGSRWPRPRGGSTTSCWS